ncbi:hypothetical protein KT71_003830 [Congregibacter litoralis KT71]|uniref:Uncharacterized protein n=2 Tax=Congregibacter TaxID=393661 RepID=V7HSX1_9GAMM|nr:hypothetical protein KT71_003830 [Congregibacter litoralis KT71]
MQTTSGPSIAFVEESAGFNAAPVQFTDGPLQPDTTMTVLIAWVLGLLAVTQFIRHVTKDADDDLAPEKREALSDTLLGLNQDRLSSYVPNFNMVFDRFFGENHLAWRCFLRSTIVSVVLYMIVATAFGIAVTEKKYQVGFLAMVGLLLNAPADYISLLETRWLLGKTISIRKKIVLDIVFTSGITVLWLALTAFTVAYWATIQGSGPGAPDIVAKLVESLATMDHDTQRFLLSVVITAFSTSVWFWLHGLSEAMIKTYAAIKPLMSWLNVRGKPLRAIGVVINVYVIAIAVIILPVYWALK